MNTENFSPRELALTSHVQEEAAKRPLASRIRDAHTSLLSVAAEMHLEAYEEMRGTPAHKRTIESLTGHATTLGKAVGFEIACDFLECLFPEVFGEVSK